MRRYGMNVKTIRYRMRKFGEQFYHGNSRRQIDAGRCGKRITRGEINALIRKVHGGAA